MEKERKLIIAGNWKMNKTVAEALDLVKGLKLELSNLKDIDVIVCPPYTALSETSKEVIESDIRLGCQNMSEQSGGAYTGEISANMLKEFLVRYVILGHSERRAYQNESDELVNTKAKVALAASLKPIICVGETLEQREADDTETVIGNQLRGSLAGLEASQMEDVILAYEPVWAIGTGKTASAEQAQAVHAFIRGVLVELFGEAIAKRVRIQYGGSVKPNNARELLGQPDIDGALVGGAALEVRSFSDIVKNCLD
ncbi:MAG: triose-phosphate isomerase [Verrucomicrobiia bacterium]|jgi:triosephosphate isomerase